AVSWGPNHIDVFALDTSNRLVQKTYDNGTWTATWLKLGVPTNNLAGSVPSVTSPAANQITLFSRSTANTVITATLNNGVLSAWPIMGGSIKSATAPKSWR